MATTWLFRWYRSLKYRLYRVSIDCMIRAVGALRTSISRWAWLGITAYA
jgi:hypothetical protein